MTDPDAPLRAYECPNCGHTEEHPPNALITCADCMEEREEDGGGWGYWMMVYPEEIQR